MKSNICRLLDIHEGALIDCYCLTRDNHYCKAQNQALLISHLWQQYLLREMFLSHFLGILIDNIASLSWQNQTIIFMCNTHKQVPVSHCTLVTFISTGSYFNSILLKTWIMWMVHTTLNELLSLPNTMSPENSYRIQLMTQYLFTYVSQIWLLQVSCYSFSLIAMICSRYYFCYSLIAWLYRFYDKSSFSSCYFCS